MYHGTWEFWHVVLVPGNGNVRSVGQRLGEALQGFSPHNDLVSGSQGFKSLKGENRFLFPFEVRLFVFSEAPPTVHVGIAPNPAP